MFFFLLIEWKVIHKWQMWNSFKHQKNSRLKKILVQENYLHGTYIEFFYKKSGWTKVEYAGKPT